MRKILPQKKLHIFLLILIIIAAIPLSWIGYQLHSSYALFFNYLNTHHLSPVSQKEYHFGKNEAGTMTYVLLGDSLTDGVGNKDPGLTLPAIIAGNLQNQQKSGTVIKLAQAGATTRDVLKNQVPEAIDIYPDYILVFIGTNDVHNPITDQAFSGHYREMIDTLNSKTRADITLVNIPYIGSDKILLPPWDKILDWRIQRFNKIIQQIAAEKNLKTIDLYSSTKNQFTKSSDLYSEDEFHPSDKGYKLWADIILSQW